MKKLLLVLALVLAYGLTISNASTNIVKKAKSESFFVDDSSVSKDVPEEKDKKNKKEKKATSKTKAKVEVNAEKHNCAGSGCGEAQKKSCAASKKSCCGTEKK